MSRRTFNFKFSILNLTWLLLFSSCIRDLEQEGIYSESTVKGRVVEQTTQQPVDGLHVRLLQDGQALQTTLTAGDGTFLLPLQFEQLDRGVSLEVFADSLYVGTSVTLEPQGYGREYYDVGTLYVVGPTLPVVATLAPSSVTATTALGGGSVTSSGNSAVVRRGLCWSKLQYPTLANAYSVDGSGEGDFTSTMANLEVGTTYYVRAYATNGVGTAYGNQQTFTTLAGLPTVVTAAVTDISPTTAVSGGSVADDGTFAVTQRGVCWSTSPDPTIANARTIDAGGLGTFVSTVGGLTPGTTYYLRAYATNQNGTAYGEQRTFATPDGHPVVSTTSATSIAATSAVCGGNVSSDGGFPVTARGVCYSTTPAPTTASPHTTDGSGTGPFVSHLTNLSPGTTYYYRAYATNATGTVYGEERMIVSTAQ